ncbi:MAG TPA: hypothetical protein VG826_18635 [Pirellulales bacterium]|nr:hypothetical protein [Pirellulales bacterium]
MPIAVRCRLCGRPYNLADRFAGQVVQCKECQAVIQVPAAGPLAAPRRGEPQYGVLPLAEPVEAPKRPLPPPLPATPVPAAPWPARPTPGSPLLAPRRKKNKVPLILAAVGSAALGLVVLVAAGFVVIGKLAPRVISFSAGTPRGMPVTFAGSHQTSPSNARQFEELLQKFLAALQAFNGALAKVVDSQSARRQADQVMARYNDLTPLLRQVTAFVPRITAEEDRRLEAMYGAQLTSAIEQLKVHVMRIRQMQHAEVAFGGRLPFDDLHDRMGRLHGAGMGFGPGVPGASFQPPASPAIQPPRASMSGFQPPIARPPLARPPITRPPMTRPPMVGPTGPRHAPFNHGMRGPGAMHGRGR